MFNVHKVIATLPEILEPDAVYFVRAGEGFDLYIVDSTGQVSHTSNSASRLTAMQAVIDDLLARVAVLEGGDPPGPVVYPRAASPVTVRSIHSGHSLTDSYTNQPWPGGLHLLRETMFEETDMSRTVKSTIPGSATEWRWNNPLPTPNDARVDIALYELMVITERGLNEVGVASPDDPTARYDFLTDLEFEYKFVENAYLNGNSGSGASTLLYSIWPGMDMEGDYNTVLRNYERRFRYRMDWLNFKLKQNYPTIPDTFKVWMVPGHRLMIRIQDDIAQSLVPGVTTYASLFDDAIHPGDNLSAAVAYLVFTVMFQRNLSVEPAGKVWKPAGMSQELCDYFRTICWEIATTYAPCGMGGTDEGAAGFNPLVDEDPRPDLGPGTDPEPGDGETPIDIMAGYSGPNLLMQNGVWTGTVPENVGPAGAPAVTGGALIFAGAEVVRAPLAMSGARYMIEAKRLSVQPTEPSPHVAAVAIWATNPGTSWMGNKVEATVNGYTGDWTVGNITGEVSTTTQSKYDTAGGWEIVESWVDADTINSQVATKALSSHPNAAPLPATTHFLYGGGTNGGNAADQAHIDVAGLYVCGTIPTEDQRARLRAWAQARIDATT